MSEPHNHHFVPQGYLRGFANGHGRKAKILAIDRVEKKAFRTLVRNVAAVRDFNRFDAHEADPNIIEKSFAEFEGEAAEALRRVEQSGSFAAEEDRRVILNLIALLAARNPRTRNVFGKFLSDVFRSVAQVSLSTKDRWDTFRRQLEESESNVERLPDISYEVLRDFVRSDEFELLPNQSYQIDLEMGSVDTVLQALIPRKWTLFTAANGAGDFITSDHPVCLVNTGPPLPGPLKGVGFGMAETAVLFPLCRTLLLCGRFEGIEQVRHLGSFAISKLNSQIIQRSDRQVFAYDENFKYARPNGIATGSELAKDELFHRHTER